MPHIHLDLTLTLHDFVCKLDRERARTARPVWSKQYEARGTGSHGDVSHVKNESKQVNDARLMGR